jgi:hypothetical protein
VAHDKHARELDQFRHALNCAANWKCRWKAKQDQSQEPQRSSNSEAYGLGSHFVPGAVPAKHQKTKGCASVVDKSRSIVHQSSPTAKKRCSWIAGKKCRENVAGAQARQSKQNERRIPAWSVTVRQPQSQPDNEPHWKKEAESDQVSLRGTSFSKLADRVWDVAVARPERRKVERAEQHHGSRYCDQCRRKELAADVHNAQPNGLTPRLQRFDPVMCSLPERWARPAVALASAKLALAKPALRRC